MDRRFSARARVNFPLKAFVDGFRHRCRIVDISSTGMVVERSESLSLLGSPEVTSFEFEVGGGRPIRIRGRTIWTEGRLQAVRFVGMRDVDRLTIAEELDRAMHRGDELH